MTVSGSTPASRLAPSPTGPLHLGNACTFLVNWALARNLGWRLHFRVEDLDSARVNAARATAQTHAQDDLHWLGIDHDGPVIHQSDRLALYEQAMHTLARAGVVYASPHSRSEVREAAAALSAPHAPVHSGAPAPHAFPRSLRPPPGPAWAFTQPAVNHRFAVGDAPLTLHDELRGESHWAPATTDGDFLVWTKAGVPAYQLAVVVDDALQGVTDVVRGDDLLPSAALQTLIYRALGAPPPRWWHVPLVRDAAGQRMAKRIGSASLAALREQGTDAARVVGLAGWWVGAQAQLAPMVASEFRRNLAPSMLRTWCERAQHDPPTVTPRIMEWLTRT